MTESYDPFAEGVDAVEDEEHEGAGLRGRLESLLPGVLPGVLRRTVSTGQGARQMTEDVIRGAISDLRLPKEAVHTIVEIADTTKKEVVRVAAREFRDFLESARFNDELAKILTGLSLEIKTEIRFVPNADALKPAVTSKASIHAGDGEDPVEVPAAESLNESIRSGAQDIAELMLARLFRRAAESAHEEVAKDVPVDDVAAMQGEESQESQESEDAEG